MPDDERFFGASSSAPQDLCFGGVHMILFFFLRLAMYTRESRLHCLGQCLPLYGRGRAGGLHRGLCAGN